MVEIRRCRPGEIDRVMKFIDHHWQRGHALAASRDLMNWQHGANDGGHDYLIALQGDKLLGVLGYISSKRFDPCLAGNNVIWLALWKVMEDVGITGLGLRMLDSLKRVESHVAIAVNGINLAHPPMYRALRYQVGELKQYFVTNPIGNRRLISAPTGHVLPVPKKGSAVFVEMTQDALMNIEPTKFASPSLPQKTPIYFLNRFLRHPFYRYRIFLAQGENLKSALIATRVAEHEGARALRIVDFAGDPRALSCCGSALASLMGEEHAEYADFWHIGFPEEALLSAGFAPVAPDGSVIVPNYFEPFLARNGQIFCAIKTSAPFPAMIFRADGDQDRPNQLPKTTP